MTIPASEGALGAELAAGTLQEGERLDFKQQLELGERANRDLAVDVASFAPAGGTILVGVDDGRPPTLSPVPLRGLRERVEQVVRDRVDPPPRLAVREIPSSQAGRGYLVIEVPPTGRAHQVEHIFRGRRGSTNVRLSTAEVEAFLLQDVGGIPDVLDILRTFVANDPTPADQCSQAHLFAVALPRGGDPEMLETAVGRTWEQWTRTNVVNASPLTQHWSPDFGQAGSLARIPDGWAASSQHQVGIANDPLREGHYLEVVVGEDGSLRLFCGRATDTATKSDVRERVIFEVIIAGLVLRLAQLAGVVAIDTGFTGDWDFGLALTNLRGAYSYFRGWPANGNHWMLEWEDLTPYVAREYERTWRLTTADLVADPVAVVERLVGPLNRTLTSGRFDIRALPPVQGM